VNSSIRFVKEYFVIRCLNEFTVCVHRKLAARIGELSSRQAKSKGKISSTSEETDSIQYELCVQSGGNKTAPTPRITDLENRIQMLESVLGSDQKEKLVSTI